MCGITLTTKPPEKVEWETGAFTEWANNAILELETDPLFYTRRMRLYKNYGTSKDSVYQKFARNLTPCMLSKFRGQPETDEICKHFYQEFKREEWLDF